MAKVSAEYAIIGAGPAGSHLASRLAGSGRECLLFDPKGAWEKPCGGGVPTRAIREFAFLLESSGYPHKLVDRITMISPVGRKVSLKIDRPFAIYSRKVLNGLVLDRALEAGAEFVRSGVADFERTSDGWSITTSDGREWRAKFLIGADGAASFTRRRLTAIFPVHDLALAFGYNIAIDEAQDQAKPANGSSNGATDSAVIRFPENFTGYLWAFPRPGVMNFGVFSKLQSRTSLDLQNLLLAFIRDFFGGQLPQLNRADFFAAKIPMLEFSSWGTNRTTGEGWALIGDAAGLADPLTGEGIYYAFKSADILANALNDRSVGFRYKQATDMYELECHRALGCELEQASYRLAGFYQGKFAGHNFIDSVIRLARYHRGVREVLINTLAGEQSYLTLKGSLLMRVLKIF